MKTLSVLFVVLFSLASLPKGMAQNAQSYRVFFSDKGENESLLQNPQAFLSPKAIDNKAKRNTVIDKADLPVSKNYLNTLRGLDLTVRMKSRWFNYALVSGENVQEKVSKLPFVVRVEAAQRYPVSFAGDDGAKTTANFTYGFAANQIEMLNGDYLHDNNLLGQGMTIAVLDGGFSGANTISGLDTLRMNGRLLGTYNFVDNDTNVFSVGNHGTDVLSVMAGYVDSFFVGTAIRANYWLLKSEDQASETASEMDNWLAAAEFADSVGADIITSSLGYNTFDGGVGNLSYSDMDGNTALVTRAADMAAKKGILVITSAGNEGNSDWKYILAPADGDSVLTIGGVDEFRNYASFASQGPTADGRIKPTVSARAAGTAFVGTEVRRGNGTSFSCPVISGLAACLWQQFPTKTNMEIYEAIRTTASQVNTPNNEVGFGIANFAAASWTISNPEQDLHKLKIEVYPNPVSEKILLNLNGVAGSEPVSVKLFDITGQEINSVDFGAVDTSEIEMQAPGESGTYLLSIRIGDMVYLRKIIK